MQISCKSTRYFFRRVGRKYELLLTVYSQLWDPIFVISPPPHFWSSQYWFRMPGPSFKKIARTSHKTYMTSIEPCMTSTKSWFTTESSLSPEINVAGLHRWCRRSISPLAQYSALDSIIKVCIIFETPCRATHLNCLFSYVYRSLVQRQNRLFLVYRT